MAKKAAQAPAAEIGVEAVGKPGLGIDDGIILTTSFVLALAITLVVIANNAYA
jgi:hypothetical protein